MIYRVKNWSKHFESSESKRIGVTKWLPLPNKFDGLKYRKLTRLPNASTVFAGWVSILQVASTMETRGLLVDGGQGLTTLDLELLTGLPKVTFDEALEALINPEIGWMEIVETDVKRSQPGRTGQNREETEELGFRNGNIDQTRSSIEDNCNSRAGPGATGPVCVEGKGRELKGRERKGKEKEEGGEAPLPPGFDPSIPPSLAAWLTNASMIGYEPKEAETAWNGQESHGWKRKGEDLRDWRRLAVVFRDRHAEYKEKERQRAPWKLKNAKPDHSDPKAVF